MTLAEALTLPSDTTISSIECIIKNEIHSFATKSGKAFIYNITDINETCNGQLIVWDVDKKLSFDHPYKLASTIKNGRLSGVTVSKYKNYPSRINCTPNTSIININNNMDTIEYKPMNDKTALMNYYGKTYLEMRSKMASAPDVSRQEAHEAAIDFVNWIPKSFFGDKPLP